MFVYAHVRTTLTLVLLILALVFTVLAAIGKGPLWPAVLLVILERLVPLLPND